MINIQDFIGKKYSSEGTGENPEKIGFDKGPVKGDLPLSRPEELK